MAISQSVYGNITVSTSSLSTGVVNPSVLAMSNGTGTGTTWSNAARTTANGKLVINGEDADVVMNGVSLKDTLNAITDRLTILQPKPELLEKYENLREAYEHYKTLETLLSDHADDEKQ